MSQTFRRSARVALLAAAVAATLPAAAGAQGAGSPSNDFNPSMGLILTGTYAQLSQDPEAYHVPGFALGEESAPPDRGFAIGESELAVTANVDPDFYGAFTLSMAGDGVEVENAYVQTTSLGQGLTLRLGRFFSGIGYLDEQHAHTWDFVDTALPYRVLLGNQVGDDGVQLRWLAPTLLFTEVGAEWMRGDAFPGGGAGHHGRGAYSAFAHVGGDVGPSHSWRAGLSYLHATAKERETESAVGTDVFDGTSELVVVDGVWKWAPKGNPYRHNLKLQGEYLVRWDDGDFTPAGGAPAAYSGHPSGFYVQSTYQFVPRWRVGLRYDQLDGVDPGTGLAGSVLDPAGHTPRRVSAMVDYSNSEFSRLRLQVERDDSATKSDTQVVLQYTMSLGAHGAHIF